MPRWIAALRFPVAGVFLNVFLFEPEFFGRVEHEHFHANILRDFLPGQFRDDDHEPDGERHGPDGGLFGKDAQEGVACPEFLERQKSQVAETGHRDGQDGQQTAAEHPGRGAFHGHATPPDTHEEQWEIACGGDCERLADHEVDLELFDLGPQPNRDGPDDDGADLEGAHSLGRGGLGAQHPAVDIVGQGAGHADEQSAEGAHERGERTGAGDPAQDRSDHGISFVEDAG